MGIKKNYQVWPIRFLTSKQDQVKTKCSHKNNIKQFLKNLQEEKYIQDLNTIFGHWILSDMELLFPNNQDVKMLRITHVYSKYA